MCLNTEHASVFEYAENKQGLYCLDDFSQYKLKGNRQDAKSHNLQIVFEMCNSPDPVDLNALPASIAEDISASSFLAEGYSPGKKVDNTAFESAVTDEKEVFVPTCRDIALKYLSLHTFNFPHQNVFFLPSLDAENKGLYKVLDQDLVYPYIEGQLMRTNLMMQQARLTSDLDVSGITKMFSWEGK